MLFLLPWRGLVFGQVARKSWSGDPAEIWKAWDEHGMQGTEFIAYCDSNHPVKTGRDDIPVSVYRGKDYALLAIASWAKADEKVSLDIDWKSLGVDPSKAVLHAPPIKGFQTETTWKPGEEIPIPAGKGYFIVLGKPQSKTGEAKCGKSE